MGLWRDLLQFVAAAPSPSCSHTAPAGGSFATSSGELRFGFPLDYSIVKIIFSYKLDCGDGF